METQSAQKKLKSTVIPCKRPRTRLHEGQSINVQSILHGGRIQPKLRVGQPNDKYEQEADRVADQVMRMPTSTFSQSKLMSSDPRIQRRCDECEDEIRRQPIEEEEELLQAKHSSDKENSSLGSDVTAQVSAVRQGGGVPLSSSARNFFEPRFGLDFSGIRIHADTKAAASAQSINARAYTLGRDVVFNSGQYEPHSQSGKQLLAHELTHVVQQTSTAAPSVMQTKMRINQPGDEKKKEADQVAEPMLSSQNQPTILGNKVERPIKMTSPRIIQRDLALAPPSGVAAQPSLTNEQIQAAIRFNRRRYSESSIRQIQDVAGAGVTGVLDDDTIRLIAQLQEDFGLKRDGMVGSDTFDLINRELSAEGAATDTCLSSFRVTGPSIPMDLRALPGGLANIFSRFDVDIGFSSRCNCSDFEYRQFICGDVTRTTGGVTTSENRVFNNLPAGQLLSCPDWREDGDTSVPVRYGHRSAAGRAENRYLDDTGGVSQADGCTFESFDVPGIWGLTAVSGSQYNFDIRFFGDIRRKGVGRLERKFWAVRDTVTLP